MTPERFNDILARRLEVTKAVLTSKAQEYSSGKDRLHNFNRAAAMLGTTPEKALVGMWTKHIVSILDIVDSEIVPSLALLEEKVTDAVNYLILLEACYKDKMDLITVQNKKALRSKGLFFSY